MVSSYAFGSQGPRFESHWRQNSTHDCIMLYYTCTWPFIITLPSSQYDLNNVERNVKDQIISNRKVNFSYFSIKIFVVDTH